jgi:hypothetical protein
MPLRKFVIEREMPKAGPMDHEHLRPRAAKSNGVLHQAVLGSSGLDNKRPGAD